MAVGARRRAEDAVAELLLGAELVECLVLEEEDEEVKVGGEGHGLGAELVEHLFFFFK